MLDHWPGTTGSYPCWVKPTDSSRNWLNTTWFSQHHHLPCTGINLPCTGKQETFHNQYFCHPQWMARYPKHVVTLRIGSDKVIISQFKWNFRKRTDFCLPLWKARYLQHNAAVRAMVPQRQLLIYKVLVQGDFFHPPKRYKKVILCSGKGDQNSQLDFRSAKVGRSCALSWANLSLTPRGLMKTSILDPIWHFLLRTGALVFILVYYIHICCSHFFRIFRFGTMLPRYIQISARPNICYIF